MQHLIWLLFFFFLNRFFKPAITAQTSGIQESINRLYSTWSISKLKTALNQESQKFSNYERILSKAYDEQFALLSSLQAGSPFARNKIRQIIEEELYGCNSNASINFLQAKFEWVLLQFPELLDLFQTQRFKIQPKKQKIVKQNLFENCTSLLEIKKRFRRLAFLNHPDKGGSTIAMQEITRQYEETLKIHEK